MSPTPANGSDSFSSKSTMSIGGRSLKVHRLDALSDRFQVEKLPFCLKVLLENLLRHEDGINVHASDIEAVAAATAPGAKASAGGEIGFSPERVLMQDLTGVPAIVDLAAMRDAISQLGGDAGKINPLVPVELVVDHSVIAESSGLPTSFATNVDIEYSRNRERYQLLKWAQQAFDGVKVVPPGTGICHQVNLEYLARVVFETTDGWAFPDTLVGTDSHTTMVNGLGVLGWGVGGIEAEAAMLGQAISMLVPPVVGFKLEGQLPSGVTATDLVLTVTQMLRAHGVVGKFVEFTGPGLASLPVEHRATIANMSPEYGATCGIFPIDEATLTYLRFTGRSDDHVALVEAYAKEQGMWANEVEPTFSEILGLDLSTVVPSLAGPSRPQDRVSLSDAKTGLHKALDQASGGAKSNGHSAVATLEDGTKADLTDGSVVIAAITSCTNTSNPYVLVAAGLVAKKAVELGLKQKPWVKTSLAPGSRVVMDYLERANLLEPLDALGFELVGFGCTTCIGNSGPLLPGVSEAVKDGSLSVASVLSGNRNFEGRVHNEVRLNYLASPPLVVAYALSGTMDFDPDNDPIAETPDGRPVTLAELWPSDAEIVETVRASVTNAMYRERYSAVYDGDERWAGIDTSTGDTYAWDPNSTYAKRPPYFDGMGMTPKPVTDVHGARVLAILGDSVTTDHISPAGSIAANTPAARYLEEHGVQRADFNSYGARRGNHEVMVRGTFANIRLKNLLAPGTEGGVTQHQPDGEQTSIFDASVRYQSEGTPLVVLAGREYGSGSSRDWAAKGPSLLGVRAVIAQSFERIHRSNLIGMGVLPLQFPDGGSVESLGLTGHEVFEITGVETLNNGEIPKEVRVKADSVSFNARVRIDTPMEADYYRHGGILHYVLRQLASR
ncbi:MAG: aconitate hydratase AcnA [Acidimicrobiales bacterium]